MMVAMISACAAQEDSLPLNDFKKFMAEAPPSGMIGFSVTFANGHEEFYSYQWGVNAFVVRKAKQASELFESRLELKAADVGGRDGNNYWRLKNYPRLGPNLLEWNSAEDQSSPTNAVKLPVDTLLFFPHAVLSMGIMHLKPGSVRWRDNEFEYVDGERSFSGVVSSDSSGRVRELATTISSDKARKYRISYEYGDSDKPDWMPRIIQLGLVEAGNKVRKLQRYTILKASFEHQSVEAFKPTAFIQDQQIVTGFLSNDNIYFASGGKLKRQLRPEEVPAFNNLDVGRRKTIYLFSAVMVLATIAVLATKVRRRKPTSS